MQQQQKQIISLKFLNLKKMKSLILSIAFLSATTFAFSQTNKSTAVQCSAIAKSSGLQCRRMTTDSNGLCWQHGGIKDESKVNATAIQCTAIAKSTGVQCRNKTKNQSGKCHLHEGKPE